jgi:hypothetical protein
MDGKHYIQRIKAQWIGLSILQMLAWTAAITFAVAAIYHHFMAPSSAVYIVIFTSVSIVYLYFHRLWQTTNRDIARHLDANYPQLEESCSLLLKTQQTRNILQQLQVQKIIKALPLPHVLNPQLRKLATSLLALLVGACTWYGIKKIPANQVEIDKNSYQTVPLAAIEKTLPQISKYHISITPPAYTKQQTRVQEQFTIKAELGATVKWKLTTNRSIRSFLVIFNDTERIQLKPLNADSTSWSISKKIVKQGFYQIQLDGVKSDLYAIDVIPDLPVAIRITQPKPQTTIDVGEKQTINLEVALKDDYGIRNASISATMASGKGESVSFTEKTLQFDTKFNNQKQLNISKHIDLKQLGMKPGDELYLFVEALDNFGQKSRSDVHTVSIVDTAELMSLSGMTSGVNLVPAYFRSQRQIIIDTEKLLNEKATLSANDFKAKANNLGVDQKLLRLRYGQFLGEENETEIGGEHHDNDGHNHGQTEEKFGDVQAIMDRYAHKHDIAEDATFFEPEIKAQLKAVLNEMWKAELQLRTYKLQEALPFEYKALRLLKDLQQSSRAYVAKTTVKTAALKPEKRLTGELDKITNPQQQVYYQVSDKSKAELRVLLAVLNQHNTRQAFSTNEVALLKTGEIHLVNAAASHPATYLAALKGIRKLNSQTKPDISDLNIVAKAIYRIIGTSLPQPQPKNTAGTKQLSDNYFNQLKQY